MKKTIYRIKKWYYRLSPRTRKIIGVIKLILSVIILVLIFDVWGMAYFLLYYVFLALYKIIKQWDNFIIAKQSVETKIWGKPLNMFTKQELKNHKVVFTRRKDKK